MGHHRGAEELFRDCPRDSLSAGTQLGGLSRSEPLFVCPRAGARHAVWAPLQGARPCPVLQAWLVWRGRTREMDKWKFNFSCCRPSW